MNAFEWATATTPTEPPAELYCRTSDVWEGRVSKLEILLKKQGVNDGLAALFFSATAEIGDNCFAHNAPNWIDVSGCWFEYAVDLHQTHCIIADRGRGILTSLRDVRPSLASHGDALHMSLTERITSRAPEKRGNGLKFVIDTLTKIPKGTFMFQSGNAIFSCDLPLDKDGVLSYIHTAETTLRGTYCAISFIY